MFQNVRSFSPGPVHTLSPKNVYFDRAKADSMSTRDRILAYISVLLLTPQQ